MKIRQRSVFALRLKQALSEKGLKLREVATSLGVPLSTVGNWTQGRAMPSGDLMTRLAKILDVTPASLRADDQIAVESARETAAGVTAENRFLNPVGLPAESNPHVAVTFTTGEKMLVPLTEVFPASTVVAWLAPAEWKKMAEAMAFLGLHGEVAGQGKILAVALQRLTLDEHFLEAYANQGPRPA